MKLYRVAAAPNPTKVMLYIAEREALGAQIPVEQVSVNVIKGEHRAAEHLARNPFGTLPVLALDDGSYLLESLSIIMYLESRFPEHRLLPVEIEACALAKDLERTVEMRVAMPIARYVHATRSPLGYPPDLKVAGEIEGSLPVALKWLEKKLSDGREMLMGSQVSIADCTLQSALQFARFGQADLIGAYPLLAAWDSRYRARQRRFRFLSFSPEWVSQ